MSTITRIEDIGKDGDPPWAIDGVLSGLTILWGQPGAGKSFIAMSMAAAVATGRPWLGRQTAHGQVVYVAGEGGLTNVGHRLRTALHYWGILPIQEDYVENAIDLSVIVPGVDLVSNPSHLFDLIGGHTKLQLLVIDTLSRCLVGDENKQEDMGKFVRALDITKDQLGCDILIIHHANRQDEIRGSSVLFGAADVSWHLNKGKVHSMQADKLRERDSDDAMIKMRLSPAPIIGRDQSKVYDELGSEQTTLVVQPMKETISQVVVISVLGKGLIEDSKQATTYSEWKAAANHLSKTDFDNALYYILSYPGKWGITRGKEVGTFIAAGGEEYSWRQ